MKTPKRDVPMAICATCNRESPWFTLGAYDDSGRSFCLRGPSGRGGECFRERPIDRGVSPHREEALARMLVEREDLDACIEIVRAELGQEATA